MRSCGRWREVDVASWTSRPAAVAGRWVGYRHVASGLPPLWYGAGSTTLGQVSGRWHREGEALGQYLALSSDGAWAERVRYESLRTEADRLADHRCLWHVRVSADRIADLSTFDAWDACGLDPAVAVGDHADSQALASELRRAGYRGVLSPSAALDVAGAVNPAPPSPRPGHVTVSVPFMPYCSCSCTGQ
jgi:hypothetical protein